MANESEILEAIEACRTCGIYYMTTSNYLKPIFQSPVEQPEMMLIRLELAQWKVEVNENDGYPQYVCSTCIHEFQRVFKFRTSCVETQEQFRHFYSIREENRANIKIKTEIPDPTEEKGVCDFIYVDELSDTEYDGATPFNIPHVPIKEELIEAATIPMEDSGHSINMVESASRVVVHANVEVPSSLNQAVVVHNEINIPAVVAQQMPPEPVECKLCQHLSLGQEEHKQHMQRAHEIKDVDCKICGKKFKNSTQARLKFHMKWHNLNKHVKCNLCGFVCNSKEALQEHKRANHGKNNCKICGKGVLAKKMKSHLREHELLAKYPCEYCTATFSSENERESHIWQTHNDDHNENNQNDTTPNQTILAEDTDSLPMPTEEEEEALLRDDGDDGAPEDLDNYKFFCAHCEGKFMQQIDLEIHVNQEHRLKSQLSRTTTNELESAAINQDLTRNTNEMSSQEILSNDDIAAHAAIAVFEDYDNEKQCNILPHQEANDEGNNLSSLDIMPIDHHAIRFPQSGNISNPTENLENQHEDDNEVEALDREDSANEHFEVHTESQNENTNTLAQSSSESDTSVSSETDEAEEEEDVSAETYMPSYANNEMNSFACAKCSDIFASIEQLRIHHEQHLAAANNPQPETSSRAKFKCNICTKTFDLKFSLNRHIKKHKHAPF